MSDRTSNSNDDIYAIAYLINYLAKYSLKLHKMQSVIFRQKSGDADKPVRDLYNSIRPRQTAIILDDIVKQHIFLTGDVWILNVD